MSWVQIPPPPRNQPMPTPGAISAIDAATAVRSATKVRWGYFLACSRFPVARS